MWPENPRFSTALAVCIPYSASAGTARLPNKSCSMRLPRGGADLREAAIAGHLQPLAASRPRLRVVCEQCDQARSAAADRCHTMDGVAPFEQQQRARMHRYAHHAFAGTLEQTLNTRIVFIRRAANQRHVFEIAAGLRRSKRYRRDEVGLVEMPVQAFAL